MIKIVSALPRATKMLKYRWPFKARNVSCGPYAEDESPSAPSPTQAKKAISDILLKTSMSYGLRALPIRSRLRRSNHDNLSFSSIGYLYCVSLAFRSCRRHCEPEGRGNLAFHQKQGRDCFALARNDLKLLKRHPLLNLKLFVCPVRAADVRRADATGETFFNGARFIMQETLFRNVLRNRRVPQGWRQVLAEG